ncbi:hypothetical protein [Rhizobium sp. AC27/96]|uniref:hypothetical protein n=1 Tax=Rhizobium sp. AC27/96 TaxID=1841653 RepID=UPI000B3332F4|nr:hypothetical protein [Rhizobium sp. AC27/96]
MNAALTHLSTIPLASAPVHLGKGKRGMLARVIGIWFATVVLGLPTAEASAAKPAAGPAGHYCGKLLSAGSLVDVETSLQVDTQGHIAGTYRFQDDGNTTIGALSEIGTAHGRKRTLRWFDKYGMGSLTIRFDAEYDRFEGLWGPQDAVPSYTWNGGNCHAPIS